MEPDLQGFLVQLEAQGRKHDAVERDDAKRMFNLDPNTARLLSILIRSSHRTRVLEIGTSNGYSTIWLAWAARATAGHVTSIDRKAEKLALADENLRRTGLRDQVTLLQGEATQVIATLPGPFDFVFFDADRASAPAQLDLLVPKLAVGALVLADNACSHPDEIAGYLTAITARSTFDHVLVAVGKGLSLALFTGAIDRPSPPSAGHESRRRS